MQYRGGTAEHTREGKYQGWSFVFSFGERLTEKTGEIRKIRRGWDMAKFLAARLDDVIMYLI
jgi:hypothetical protein